MFINNNIPINKLEVNKGQIEGLPKNPRFIRDARYEALKKSIEDAPEMLSLRELLVVPYGEKYVIVGGNMRYRACKDLGYKEIPCKVLDTDLDVAKLREYAIKDNQGFGQDDWDLLANEWDAVELVSWGMELPTDWGVGEEENEDGDATIVEDEIPEDVETRCKKGDVWQLGRHRLMCGDSTNGGAVALLMNGEKADLLFTDPPYNMQMTGGCIGVCANMKKVEKDIESISSFDPKPFLEIIPTIFDKNMNAYIFCNKDLVVDYLNWGKGNGYSYNILVWKKPNSIPVGDSHRPDLEYLLLFRKNAIWNNGLEGVNYSRCLEYSRVKKSDTTGNHPTVKPIELIGNEIQISSKANSIVVDLFGGSGSTLIACEQLNRTCYMCELDAHYCDVILTRWEKLTGQTATKI